MHIQLSRSALALLLLPLALAYPLLERDDLDARAQLFATKILSVAPKSGSCNNAPAAGQCRTNDQAAKPILNSFDAYNIVTPGEQAAVLSIMAFESGDFKYDTPINKEPGKGTRNMQSATSNQKYVSSIPHYGPQVSGCADDSDCLLKILTSNDYFDFGSGAWFLATQCSPEIRSGLASGSLEGWKAYITGCVSTTITPDRQAGWQRAINALSAH